jgi:hypothetical protein
MFFKWFFLFIFLLGWWIWWLCISNQLFGGFEYQLEFSSVGPSCWFTFEKRTIFMLRIAHFSRATLHKSGACSELLAFEVHRPGFE